MRTENGGQRPEDRDQSPEDKTRGRRLDTGESVRNMIYKVAHLQEKCQL